MKKKLAASPGFAELLRNPRRVLRAALIVAAYLIAFVILDFITKQFEGLQGIVAWYPPAGLTYTLLLVFGVRFAPAVTIALFISSLFIYRMPQPPYALFLWAFFLSLIYGVAAAFLRKRIRFDWHLRKLRDVTWFVFTTVFVSALLAVLSVSSSALSSAMPRSEVLRAIFDWWIGETVGVLTVTPFLLIYVMPVLKRFAEGQPVKLPAYRSFPRPTLSAIGQVASIALTLYWVFGAPVLDEFHPLYLIALPLIWIALQRGFKGISAAILALNSGVVLALWLFRFDLARLGELELLMIVNCIVGLLMGAVVSERKQAEEALRESENTLRAWLNAVQESSFMMDLEGIIVAANATVAQRLHRSVEEMVGSYMYDFVPPETMQTRRLQITQVVESGQPARFEDKRSGRIIDNLIYPVFDQAGQVKRLAILGNDITERKRTEAERQALLEIMQGVATTESLNELLELIRQSLAKVIYAENFFVVFRNKSTGLFEEVFAVDMYDPAMPPSKLERSITSYVFRTGEPLLLTQAKFEELVAHGEVELVGAKPAVWMGAPLKTPNETIGVMVVQNYEDPDCYSERDKDFLASVGMQVSLAIVRMQAAQEIVSLAKFPSENPGPVLRLRRDGIVMYANAASGALLAMWGCTVDGSAPQFWRDLVTQVLASRENKIIDIECDGKVYSMFVTPVAEMGYVDLYGRDITERKQAEEALRESEENYRSLVTEISDGIFVTDDRGALTFVNQALTRIHGYEHPDQIVGRYLEEFIAPPSLNEVAKYFRQIVDGEQPQAAITTELVRPDGTQAVVEVKASVKQDNGKVVGTHGVVRDITERKQREDEIRSRTEELTTLYQLSRALSDANDLEKVFELVNRHTLESIRATFAFIALLEDGDLVPRAFYPIRTMQHDFIIGDRQPITALPVCQRVLNKNEPVILQAGSPEVGSAERATLLLDFAQSVCLVPLRVGDPSQGLNQALGLLILGEAREEKRESFTPEKIHLARSIGDQAAAAIRRLLLLEQAGRRLKHLASLSEIDRTIASNFDLSVTLPMILKHVSEQLEADAADVLVFDDRMQTLEFAAGRGFHSPAIERTRLRLGESQAGRAALERHIIQIPDIAASGTAFAQSELMKAEQVAAYFAVPLITKGQVKGVLEIYQRTPLNPNEEWLDFLRTLAGQAAIAIENTHLFENLQRSNIELGLAYDATIEGWSHALDLRDKETEGHTLRVAEMTVNLARTLGLSEDELGQVRWGGLLHDIGKMGVPDGILLKPGPLTDEEWMVMKRHPMFAFEMLSPIRYLHAALDIPYCHHEKWDGTGYPRGLKGEQIPLTARIFAVVDVWDALRSDRPYRLAWPEEKVLAHIQSLAGTHFDPKVVKIFFESGLFLNQESEPPPPYF
jgi:PAS domain S-box-containing protein/putative nucleotidyltransferase with HDIG domain